MVSLEAALACVKQDLASVLSAESIEQACERHGYHWRDGGELGPVQTVHLFLRQIVEGNVAGGEVVRLAGGGFSDSAWCQARQRLPLEVLLDLARQIREKAENLCSDQAAEEPSWRGHKVYVVDASNFSMPDTQRLREHFGEVPGQRPGCGFPIAHVLLVFNLLSGVLVHDQASAYRTGDVNNTPRAHEALPPGLQRGLHGIFPSHHARIVDFTPHRPGGQDADKGMPRSEWIRSLGKNDQVVRMHKPKERPSWLSAEQYEALPKTIEVREIRRTVTRNGFRPMTLTVLTTLLDAAVYPAEEIVALRGQRWDVETDIRHLKTTMGMEVLRTMKPQGVLKELAVFGIVYNLVRAVMLESARRQNVSPLRLSFADALAWVRHAEADHEWPVLEVVPERLGRIEPRVVKRRPKPFKLMNRPREELRKRIIDKHKGA
jgi:hypothetical protein